MSYEETLFNPYARPFVVRYPVVANENILICQLHKRKPDYLLTVDKIWHYALCYGELSLFLNHVMVDMNLQLMDSIITSMKNDALIYPFNKKLMINRLYCSFYSMIIKDIEEPIKYEMNCNWVDTYIKIFKESFLGETVDYAPNVQDDAITEIRVNEATIWALKKRTIHPISAVLDTEVRSDEPQSFAYGFNSLQDVILFEFMEISKLNERPKFNICQNCGKPFIADRPNREVYCNYPNETVFACRDIGYKAKVNNSEMLREYNRAYNTVNQRKNRRLRDIEKNYYGDKDRAEAIRAKVNNAYGKWRNRITNWKDDCSANKISVDQMKKLMLDGKWLQNSLILD